jgi:hypothetical protein
MLERLFFLTMCVMSVRMFNSSYLQENLSDSFEILMYPIVPFSPLIKTEENTSFLLHKIVTGIPAKLHSHPVSL